MPVVLGAMGLYVLMGLATRRFGRLQHVLALVIAGLVALLYLFSEVMG